MEVRGQLEMSSTLSFFSLSLGTSRPPATKSYQIFESDISLSLPPLPLSTSRVSKMATNDVLLPSRSPCSLPPSFSQSTFRPPSFPPPSLSSPTDDHSNQLNDQSIHGLCCLRLNTPNDADFIPRPIGRGREGERAREEDGFDAVGEARTASAEARRTGYASSLSEGWDDVEYEEVGCSLAGSSLAFSPPPSPPPPPPSLTPSPTRPLIRILASKVFDSVSMTFKKDRVVTVDTTTGLILSVDEMESFGISSTSQVGPDLRGGKTVSFTRSLSTHKAQ